MESSYRNSAISTQLHPFFAALLLILREAICNERVKHFWVLFFKIWEIFTNGFTENKFGIFLVEGLNFYRLRIFILIFCNVF